MSSKLLRSELQTALHSLVIGDLRVNATALLKTLGYESNKTVDLPTQPEAFAKELETRLI